MPQLQSFAQDLWTVTAPLSMIGLRLGTRMTVVRLEGGGVLLHSPVSVDDALAKEIEAIGPVKHIIAPNLFHHLHAGTARERWQEAKLYAPAGLEKKRPELRIDARLSDEADLPFAGELEPLTIRGSDLRETVFLHKRTGTVVSADLVENFHHVDHVPTRLFLKLGGVYGKPGWNRLLRFIYRDKRAARDSIDRLLRWDFDRAVIAHGEPLESGAKAIVGGSFDFLRA
ncbi:DUF4336 domain-containing protein [Polyangium aurulentum]|uniref:DUF4336 domain-containing protein n=1 Tax=Polyangium aurulentum TaxID=2567896 RepID=UPI0010AEABB9|nr:DUF4336 domain-containing protein [Polyangium aurulentum]UQA55805.1 DUF4336 domain-containing protein [Polyangium aurulentum]